MTTETFGQVLRSAIANRDMTMRDFASAMSTGISVISRVCAGRRTPNPDWLEPWADALRLTGEERERFIRLGRSARAHGKSDSSEYVKELEARLTSAEASLEKTKCVQRELEATYAQSIQLGIDLAQRLALLGDHTGERALHLLREMQQSFRALK